MSSSLSSIVKDFVIIWHCYISLDHTTGVSLLMEAWQLRGKRFLLPQANNIKPEYYRQFVTSRRRIIACLASCGRILVRELLSANRREFALSVQRVCYWADRGWLPSDLNRSREVLIPELQLFAAEVEPFAVGDNGRLEGSGISYDDDFHPLDDAVDRVLKIHERLPSWTSEAIAPASVDDSGTIALPTRAC